MGSFRSLLIDFGLSLGTRPIASHLRQVAFSRVCPCQNTPGRRNVPITQNKTFTFVSGGLLESWNSL